MTLRGAINGRKRGILLFSMLFVFTFILVLFTNNAESEAADDIVLKFGSVNPETHPFVMGIKKFAELAGEKSQGRINIQVYPSGQLGGVTEMVQAAQMGALDFTMVKPGTLVDYGYKEIGVLTLPYIFRDVPHAWKVLSGPIGDKLLAGIQENGLQLVGLGYYSESARNFFFREKKVTKISDMKGLKIRVQPQKIFVDMMEAFGASAVPIAYSELYSALQLGVVDAAENPISGYYKNKFYEVSPYYTLDGHEASPSITIASELAWNKLSDADKKLLQEAWDESEKYFRSIAEQSDQEFLNELKAAGVQIFEVDNKQEWIDAVQPLYEKYGAGLDQFIAEIQSIE